MGHRSVRIPRVMRLVESPRQVAEELAGLGRDSRFLIVHAGEASPTGYGKALVGAAGAGGWPPARLSHCPTRTHGRPR